MALPWLAETSMANRKLQYVGITILHTLCGFKLTLRYGPKDSIKGQVWYFMLKTLF